jgi:hypothetical protein
MTIGAPAPAAVSVLAAAAAVIVVATFATVATLATVPPTDWDKHESRVYVGHRMMLPLGDLLQRILRYDDQFKHTRHDGIPVYALHKSVVLSQAAKDRRISKQIHSTQTWLFQAFRHTI